MTTHYTAGAKTFHWITVVAVAGLFGLGWYMTDLDLSPRKLQLYSWHKWLGMTVLALTVARLLWRWRHPAPPLAATLPAWQRLAAHGGHFGLYVLLLAMPMIGWIRSSASGFPVVLFGVVPLPGLVGPDKALADGLETAHWAGSIVLGLLILVHAGAALWHHAVERDDTLRRMLPGTRSTAVLVLAAGLAAAPAWRAEASPTDPWTIDAGNSRLAFTARQLGVPVEGRFDEFSATIVFDPAAPGNGSVRLEIATASAATGQTEADQALASRDFFNAAEHPTAVYEATGFKAAGDAVYTIDGTLTLKGISRPVAMNATIAVSDDGNGGLKASAEGTVTLSRLAFTVGEGQWASTKTIADEVVITVSLQASREE